MKKVSIFKFFTALTLSAAFVLLAFSLNSCERDETHPLAPITGGCDTSSVSFATDVLPIFVKSCSCHAGSQSPKLTNYSEISGSVAGGSLLSAVKGSMNGNFSTSCDYYKVVAWINQGARNN